MDNELIEKLDDLVEAVMEGKYGQSTPKGKPYDPDIEVAELKQEIIDLVNQSQLKYIELLEIIIESSDPDGMTEKQLEIWKVLHKKYNPDNY